MNRKGIFVTHIAVLALILIGSILAFVRFKSFPLMQFYVVIAAVVAYITVGIIYQLLNRRLTAKLVLEYVLVGALGILLFSWTLFS